MTNFIVINRAITKPWTKRYWLMIIRATSSLSVCWHGQSAAVVGCKNILLWRWHYWGAKSSFSSKIRTSVAAYIAVRWNLTRYWHSHKFQYFIPTKLACLTESNLNFQCRIHSASSKCCSKSIQPIYIAFYKHQRKYVIYMLAKYHRNRANLVYLFSFLRKTMITFDRESILSFFCDINLR